MARLRVLIHLAVGAAEYHLLLLQRRVLVPRGMQPRPKAAPPPQRLEDLPRNEGKIHRVGPEFAS